MFDIFKRNNDKTVHVNDMDQLIGKVELIDIRESYEYAGGSLKTAKNIPMGNLLASPEKYLSKDITYYIICQSGARSGRAVRQLIGQGFDVINVAGGMGSYVGTNRK